MATWITDRTQADVDRVKELNAKARSGTWTQEEQVEWAAGMKGALSYTDYIRIEDGMKELAGIVGAEYEQKPGTRIVNVTTAQDATGSIPAWTEGVSTTRVFFPLTAKKDGLLLRSLNFRMKGYLNSEVVLYLRRYSPLEHEYDVPTDALVEKRFDIVLGLNEISLSLDDFPLEKGTEYQLYFYGVGKFYSPSVQPAQVKSNGYLDIVSGSEYCKSDSSCLFSGTVTLVEPVSAKWDINSYLTAADATRWLKNVTSIRAKCSGYSTTPRTPESLSYNFKVINQVEKVLDDIEKLVKNHSYYCSELICGGEPYYAVC